MSVRLKYHLIVLSFIIALGLCAGLAEAIGTEQFTNLLSQLKEARFADDQLLIIKVAAPLNTFSCLQVAGMLNTFSFPDDQLDAVELLKDRIIDPENRELIIAIFTFESDKKKAREMLKDITPAIPLPIGGSIGVGATKPWGKEEFARLIEKMEDALFPDDKLKVLLDEVSTKSEGFSAFQVGAILEVFSFESDRIKAINYLDAKILPMSARDARELIAELNFTDLQLATLTVIVDTISDVENRYIILEAFSFSSDRDKARKILESIQASNSIFGAFAGKNVIFVVDMSGSMSAEMTTRLGERLTRMEFVARELGEVMVKQFKADTRFNLILFNDSALIWRDSLQKATSYNIREVTEYLKNLKPNGGTNIYEALETAFQDDEVSVIYFITDGLIAPANRLDVEQALQDVQKWNKGRFIPVHTVALLSGDEMEELQAYTRDFMLRLARITGGVYREVSSGSEIFEFLP